MLELKDWDSFCVIAGSAAGALIGLQFVVMTLVANRPERPSTDAGAAFATPTIVHFCAVLFLAAILRAPWKTVLPAAIIWGIAGFCGIAYIVIVIRRMRRAQTIYKPESDDWLFYVMLPLAAYAALAGSAFAAPAYAHESLFAVAASMLLLLFTGIRNAWDNVAYHVFARERDSEEDKSKEDNSG